MEDPLKRRHFRQMLAGPEPVVAPNVLNPLTARIAEDTGFRAIYLGGGPLGYVNCGLEANLTLTDVVHAGVEIRAHCNLPLILDGVCGWGDPMHMHRTIPMVEAAGFCAIEIEDQLIPKRAHHHVDVEHMIPQDLMVAKIEQAIAARKDPDLLVIGRTNGIRSTNMDDALRRAEAYKKAGADILFLLHRTPDEAAFVAERLPPPLMYMTATYGGIETAGVSPAELGRMGYRLIVVPMNPVLVFHRAMRQTYQAIFRNEPDPLLAGQGKTEHEALNATVGLEGLLEVERRTVETDLAGK